MPVSNSNDEGAPGEAVHSPEEKVPQARRSQVVDLEHPWLGLDSFREETRAYFFGRDAEIAELHLRLRSHPLLVLYSRSGLGKTSILSAGLIPRLRKAGLSPTLERLRYTKEHGDIYCQLFAALCNPLNEGGFRPFVPSFVHVKVWIEKVSAELHIKLPDDSASRLWLRLHYRKHSPETTHLILDQFEEVFTLGAQRPGVEDEVRDALAILLQGAIPEQIRRLIDEEDRILDNFDPDSKPMRVILSLRDDFVYALNRWRRHLPALGQNNFELRALRGLAAFDAVFKPGELRCHFRGGIGDQNKVDTGLPPIVSKETAERIVRFVAKKDEDVPIEEIEAVPPILSLLCRELNLRRFREPGGTESAPSAQISFNEGDTDIESIIVAFYERCLAGRPEAVRIFIEEELVGVSGARLQQDQQSILTVFAEGREVPGAADGRRAMGYGDPAKARECLEDLVTQRLLTSLGGSENPNYELVHDLLAGIVEKSRSAREQRFEKEQAELRAEARLHAERAEVEKRQREEALRRALRQKRNARRVLAVESFLLVVAVLSSLLAVLQWRRALHQGHVAEEQRRIAQSRELAAAATLNLETRPELSLLLAAEAANAATTEEADAALRQSLFESHLRAVFPAPGNAVTHLALSPDGRFAISALKDGGLAIWEPGLASGVVTVPAGTNSVTAAAFSPDSQFLVISSGNTARILETRTEKLLAELAGHTDAIKSVAFSSDAKLVITTSRDNTARVWDRSSGRDLVIWQGREGSITSAAFSSDGERVVSTTTVGTAQIWEARTGRELTNLIGHARWISSAAFSPDGRRVVTASEDNTARVWEAESGQELAVLGGHAESLNSAAFSPDGLLVVTASKDATARVWVAENGKPVAVLRGHNRDVLAATFTKGGQSVVSLGADNTVKEWDAGVGRQIARHDNPVNCAVLSVDGGFVIAGLSDGTATVWDTSTGRARTNLAGHTAQVTGAALSSDGKWAITTSADGSALLWDATTWNLVATPVRPAGLASSGAAFSPDANWAAIAGVDKTVLIWDVRARQTVTNLVGHTGPVNGALFSPDGRLVITASEDKTARLWRSDNWALVANLVHSNSVVGAAFSKDSQFVYTASADNRLLRWAARSGDNLATVRLQETARLATSVAFSPDGEFVAATSIGSPFATLWKTSTGGLVVQLKGQSGLITSAGFSTDGKLVVIASTDGTVRVYSVEELAPITDLLAFARKRGTRELTPEEKRRYLH